jgi:hypothetical protein
MIDQIVWWINVFLFFLGGENWRNFVFEITHWGTGTSIITDLEILSLIGYHLDSPTHSYDNSFDLS